MNNIFTNCRTLPPAIGSVLLAPFGRRCFVCGHQIGTEEEKILGTVCVETKRLCGQTVIGPGPGMWRPRPLSLIDA